MDLSDKTPQELIQLYSESIKELKRRDIIRTNNVIGELGEYLAMEFYNDTPSLPNLQRAPIGTENIDAISRRGDRYSIKSTSNNTTGVFYGLEPKGSTQPDRQKFEYVIVCQFDDNYELVRILEMDWETFVKNKRWHSRMQAWNLNITKTLVAQCNIVFQKD